MSTKKYKVVIVGAGVSGIAAGTRFLSKGLDDFIILEAENRIGGRIRSVDFHGATLELGAEWCHGEKDNIVYELVKNLNILESSICDYTSFTYYLSNGTLLNEDITGRIENTAIAIHREIHENKGNLAKAKSFGEYFINEYKKRTREICDNDTEFQIAVLLLQFMHNLKLSIDPAKNWFELNIIDKYQLCEGNEYLHWGNQGYKTIIDVLTNKTSDPNKKLNLSDKVSLNKEVKKVFWNANNGVTLLCSDGSSYNCDQVILTVSLGVLKTMSSTFVPELPLIKQKAIETFELGSAHKLFLKFTTKWWPEDATNFVFIWEEDDRITVREQFPYGVLTNGRSWMESVSGFFVTGGKSNTSNVLLAWVVGDGIDEIEKLSDEIALEGCMFLLNKFLGKIFEISKPIGILRSEWKNNPHFNGCWSYTSVKEVETNVRREDLAAPLVNSAKKEVVLFAGEATHLKYFSTVHGAIETGFREADRVLNSYKSTKLIHRKVGIIGAGIAGLAAASTLHKLGWDDFLVIEAQERAGGRIRSVNFGGGILELGAQWIHGRDNPVYELARDRGLLSPVTSEEGLGVYIRDNGDIIDEDVVKRVDFEVGCILGECEKFVTASDYPNSLAVYLQERFMEYLNKSNDSEEIRMIKLELLHWHVVFQLIDNSCMSLDRLSAKYWGNYVCLDDVAHSNLKCEFEKIINILIEELPKNSLLLSKPVASIKRAVSSFERHQMICESGEVITCDYLIITSSLGVLKDFKVTPPLPIEVRQSIEDVGFDAIGKVFLIFDRKWWSEKGFQFVWRADSKLPPEINWIRCISGFEPLVNGENILLGWVGGEGVKSMESLTDEDVGIHCMILLRRFIRDRTIPDPIKVVRTTWLSNRWIRGSYSHITPNCDRSGSGMHKLSEPILVDGRPRILIAGEASHPSHYSTVHGAFESGQKQAQLLAEYLIKDSKL